MGTVNDWLHFSSCLDVIGVLTGVDDSNFNESKRNFIDNFRDVEFEVVLIMLNLFDDIHIIFPKQTFHSNPIIKKLRDRIFEIYDNKMAEERLDTLNKPITLENIS